MINERVHLSSNPLYYYTYPNRIMRMYKKNIGKNGKVLCWTEPMKAMCTDMETVTDYILFGGEDDTYLSPVYSVDDLLKMVEERLSKIN